MAWIEESEREIERERERGGERRERRERERERERTRREKARARGGGGGGWEAEREKKRARARGVGARLSGTHTNGGTEVQHLRLEDDCASRQYSESRMHAQEDYMIAHTHTHTHTHERARDAFVGARFTCGARREAVGRGNRGTGTCCVEMSARVCCLWVVCGKGGCR